jgi:RNA polymerase sigma-70 factor, ECF subfamily
MGLNESERPLTFEEVYDDRRTALVWRLLRLLGVAPADLEDETLHVFLIVLRQLPNFRRESSVETWIAGICRKRAAAYRRLAHRRHEDLGREAPDTPAPASQDEAIDRKRYIECLMSVLEKIEEERRLAFWLYNVEEESVSAIAELLGWKRQTTVDRLEAVHKIVKTAFARRFPPGRLR